MLIEAFVIGELSALLDVLRNVSGIDITVLEKFLAN